MSIKIRIDTHDLIDTIIEQSSNNELSIIIKELLKNY